MKGGKEKEGGIDMWVERNGGMWKEDVKEVVWVGEVVVGGGDGGNVEGDEEWNGCVVGDWKSDGEGDGKRDGWSEGGWRGGWSRG